MQIKRKGGSNLPANQHAVAASNHACDMAVTVVLKPSATTFVEGCDNHLSEGLFLKKLLGQGGHGMSEALRFRKSMTSSIFEASVKKIEAFSAKACCALHARRPLSGMPWKEHIVVGQLMKSVRAHFGLRKIQSVRKPLGDGFGNVPSSSERYDTQLRQTTPSLGCGTCFRDLRIGIGLDAPRSSECGLRSQEFPRECPL
jgi:hypothetical protein